MSDGLEHYLKLLMDKKRFEDDGIKCNLINNYNYALLDTYYESDGKIIIEWNKHSDNVEYTDLERITEILNIKQMRLESLMKHREEIGKLFDKIDKQQSTIQSLKEELKLEQDFSSRWQKESEMLAEENKQLKGKIVSERCTNKRFDNAVHFKRCPGFSRSLKSILRLVNEE